jgi:hypothetical protein
MNQALQDVIEHRRTTNVFEPNRTIGPSRDTSPDFLQPSELAIPVENHRLLFKRYIEPRWGNRRLGAVRTMEVEQWLHSLPLAPSSKAKLKCVLSTLYHHAIRYEWLTFMSG